MSHPGVLASLAAVFAQLSLMAFGGGTSILGEMQRQAVEVHGWMRAEDFAALYALAQAAPGPNMLVVTLIGWQVAGVPGALVATGALCAPSSILTYVTAGLWYRFRDKAWRRTVQSGLVPVTAGLVMGAAALLANTTSANLPAALLTAGALGLFLCTRVHPLVVLAAGGVLGAVGIIH